MSDSASVYSFDYATDYSGDSESVSSSRSRPFARRNVRFPTVDPALLQEESFEEHHHRYMLAVYGYDPDSSDALFNRILQSNAPPHFDQIPWEILRGPSPIGGDTVDFDSWAAW